jgi:hypothetical protein
VAFPFIVIIGGVVASLKEYAADRPSVVEEHKSFASTWQRKSSRHSKRDRQMFALGLAVNRTAHRGSREKRQINADYCQGSPFSAVQLVEQESRKK